MNPDAERVVRLLFVGDSFVGKSSLLNLLCQRNSNAPSGEEFRALSTTGCNAQVFYDETVKCMVECIEIGGHPKYKISRKVFYQEPFDGIVLVYDLTRRTSYGSVRKWLLEAKTEWMRQPLNRPKVRS